MRTRKVWKENTDICGLWITQYTICVMKPSLKILWKTKITFLIGKIFVLIFKQKYIFFYFWKSIFLGSLRNQLPQHSIASASRQILKNIDMSQQTSHHLLTIATSFIKVETAILMKCGFCFCDYKMVTWWSPTSEYCFVQTWVFGNPLDQI